MLAATLGTFANFAPLLSVVPLWSAEGGSGHGGVGAATGVTMATTVCAQLGMGWLLRRFELRHLLAAGALLLGVPTFAYLASSELGWVLAVSGVRGLGFGLVVVTGSALIAELVPVGQRGRAVGWYGVAVGVPQVTLLPLGVWCSGRFGFAPVFVVTGMLGVLALPLVAAMSGRRSGGGREPARVRVPEAAPVGRGSGGRWRGLAVPPGVLAVAACALGGVTSFLPLALGGSSVAAPVALFALSAALVVGRWGAGVWNDRVGAGRLVVPAAVACGLATGGFAVVSGPVPDVVAVAGAVTAAVVYGLGFGALQNDTLVVMFRRAGPGGNGMVSTVWNLAFDAGTGMGAVAVGLLSQGVGMDGAYAVAAALMLVAVVFAVRDRVVDRAPAQGAGGLRGPDDTGAVRAGDSVGGQDPVRDRSAG
ncbi:MFS transporter [Streptomyces meridianus]|uniref:MFS transporter n=1 Tax=Streptomyces meridianus TaxID=2938945 RepID=UPI002557EF5B|nr:MFS transporter [Streptomyces meridianus]